MAQIENIATGTVYTTADTPVWVAGVWECGDQRFTDLTHTLYQVSTAYGLLTPMQFYLAFATFERILLKALAQAGTGLSYCVGAAVSAAGTGHAVNDTIALPSATGQLATVLTVKSVGSGGAITGVSVTTPGWYSAAPASAVAQASTSGSGKGATFTLTSAAIPQDPIIAEFWATYQMAVSSQAHVDPSLASIQDGVGYLAAPDAPTPAVILPARIPQILAGIAQ